MEVKIGGLLFSSNFDSGNMARVEKATPEINTPEKLHSPSSTSSKQGCAKSAENSNNSAWGNLSIHDLRVDYDFKIWTKPDCAGTIYENANRTWFHFSVRGYSANKIIRIAIMNMNKQSKIYSQGYAPLYRVSHPNITHSRWQRIRDRPTWDIVDGQFILTFVHRFADPRGGATYFAFCFPWTYTETQNQLGRLEELFKDQTPPELTHDESDSFRSAVSKPAYATAQTDKQNSLLSMLRENVYFCRELLCYSLEGRRIDLLTITDWTGILNVREDYFDPLLFPDRSKPRPWKFYGKKVVFITARVHPGETPSSHVFNGLLELLLRPTDERARQLRRQFVFKLIPLLNPDGVVRGHYRTDSRGVNLNRVYLEPDFLYYPSIYATKALLVYHHTLYGTTVPYAGFLNNIFKKLKNWRDAVVLDVLEQAGRPEDTERTPRVSPFLPVTVGDQRLSPAETTDEQLCTQCSTEAECDEERKREVHSEPGKLTVPKNKQQSEKEIPQYHSVASPILDNKMPLNSKENDCPATEAEETVHGRPESSSNQTTIQAPVYTKADVVPYGVLVRNSTEVADIRFGRKPPEIGDVLNPDSIPRTPLHSKEHVIVEVEQPEAEKSVIESSALASDLPAQPLRNQATTDSAANRGRSSVSVRPQRSSSSTNGRLSAIRKSCRSNRLISAFRNRHYLRVDCIPCLFTRWHAPVHQLASSEVRPVTNLSEVCRVTPKALQSQGDKAETSKARTKTTNRPASARRVFKAQEQTTVQDLEVTEFRAFVDLDSIKYPEKNSHKDDQIKAPEFFESIDTNNQYDAALMERKLVHLPSQDSYCINTVDFELGNEGSDEDDEPIRRDLSVLKEDLNVNHQYVGLLNQIKELIEGQKTEQHCTARSSPLPPETSYAVAVEQLNCLRKAQHLSDAMLRQGKTVNSGIAFYVDLHGHCSKRGCFLYGNWLDTEEEMIDNVLYALLVSVNSPYFDFNSCNFSVRNMYQKDRRGSLTKEGSGRVAIWKHLGLKHCYTLECNYNSGPLISRLSRCIVASPPDDHGRLTPPGTFIGSHWTDVASSVGVDMLTGTTPCSGPNTNTGSQSVHYTNTSQMFAFATRYTPAHYEEVGRALLFALIDLGQTNPWPRLSYLGGPNAVPGVGVAPPLSGMTEFSSMKALRDWVRKFIRGLSNSGVGGHMQTAKNAAGKSGLRQQQQQQHQQQQQQQQQQLSQSQADTGKVTSSISTVNSDHNTLKGGNSQRSLKNSRYITHRQSLPATATTSSAANDNTSPLSVETHKSSLRSSIKTCLNPLRSHHGYPLQHGMTNLKSAMLKSMNVALDASSAVATPTESKWSAPTVELQLTPPDTTSMEDGNPMECATISQSVVRSEATTPTDDRLHSLEVLRTSRRRENNVSNSRLHHRTTIIGLVPVNSDLKSKENKPGKNAGKSPDLSHKLISPKGDQRRPESALRRSSKRSESKLRMTISRLNRKTNSDYQKGHETSQSECLENHSSPSKDSVGNKGPQTRPEDKRRALTRRAQTLVTRESSISGIRASENSASTANQRSDRILSRLGNKINILSGQASPVHLPTTSEDSSSHLFTEKKRLNKLSSFNRRSGGASKGDACHQNSFRLLKRFPSSPVRDLVTDTLCYLYKKSDFILPGIEGYGIRSNSQQTKRDQMYQLRPTSPWDDPVRLDKPKHSSLRSNMKLIYSNKDRLQKSLVQIGMNNSNNNNIFAECDQFMVGNLVSSTGDTGLLPWRQSNNSLRSCSLEANRSDCLPIMFKERTRCLSHGDLFLGLTEFTVPSTPAIEYELHSTRSAYEFGTNRIYDYVVNSARMNSTT